MADDNWGIVGHRWAVRLLQRAVEQRELSHAYLFTGPSGVGKASLARALALAALCPAPSPPCRSCVGCRLVASGSHPDLCWVAPESGAGRIKIEQVRDLQRQLSLTPNLALRRVAVLEGFEQATPSAANALLKTLEEPPEHALLVLLAPDTDSLLPTVVSRCQVISLQPLAIPAIEQALQERWKVEPEQARLLAHLCGGRLGWAVNAASDPRVLRRREQWLEGLSRLLSASLVDRFRQAGELSRDLEAAYEALEVWAGWWRDVMLTAAGVEEGLTNLDRQERLREQADRIGMERARGLVEATRATVDRLRRNANPLLALEVLLVFDLPRLR